MRKIIGVIFLLLFLNSNAWAMDFKIFDMRNKIFEESKQIKELFAHSQDTITLSSLFDACLLAMSQLDAYFNMLGIFETIEQEDLSDLAVDFVVNWLDEIKRTLDLNLNSLANIPQPLEPKTREHIEKLKFYFRELDDIAELELRKLSLIRKTIKKRIRR
ncbi:MAG: hypothetical protein AMJ95_10155 [Omnitrophica WOR_2 bacterium SM23_72]|nr:MAG: hypothetical protein AMJ95_10155 [Omnitrophica WOR_2 bacterium SM23_72]